VDILGIALANNPVYVNGQFAYRKGEYFRKELSVNNASGPVWQQVTVTASGETPVTGNVFVPKTPEAFTYDLDGNMTSDGRWNYTWDAENRLVKVESRSDTPQASWRRVEWTYDALGRRIRQTTSVWTNNAWAVVEDLKFISDPLLFGRHIAELNAIDNALVRTYVWGLDLSGTEQGAGGIGGLLWFTQQTGANVGSHCCAYDGNGNVVALVNAADGTETARYEYGPFGEPIRVTGPGAALNPFRFSTKRTDPTTELLLYEYRAYSPTLGRWLSRDPLGDIGSWQTLDEGTLGLLTESSSIHTGEPEAMLYSFVRNNSVNAIDIQGLVLPGDPDPTDEIALVISLSKTCHKLYKAYKAAKGAKRAAELARHLQRLKKAKDELKCLKDQLAKCKGKQAQEELRKKIHDLEKAIRGHEKEIRQKWPEALDGSGNINCHKLPPGTCPKSPDCCK